MKILKTGRNFLLHFLLPGLLITQLFTAVTAYAEPAADLGGALIAGDGSGDPLAKREQKEVPVIMYHLVTKNESYIGKYGITPKELENDLVFLKENGYTTILMQDLIDFVDGKGKLPEKPIVLTFDDGNSSDYIFLFPLLKKYDMKAVVSIVGKLTDEYSLEKSKVKPHLDWEQVKEMEKDGHVEIQNHSYNMHSGNGSARRDSESMEEYRARLSGDLEKTQAKVKDATGRMPT
ncbi:MAG: polysaccharide deacetylase family protein, partial [Defluviitaleaceae bacterium]|nr:polysaccharide deacetylase family protein [Defluviitaleaceae bacterium]